MAEQTMRGRIEPGARPGAERGLPSGPDLGEYQESIRQAQSCLEAAGKQLKRAEAGQADEVLHLLRSATAYLHSAISSQQSAVRSQ